MHFEFLHELQIQLPEFQNNPVSVLLGSIKLQISSRIIDV